MDFQRMRWVILLLLVCLGVGLSAGQATIAKHVILQSKSDCAISKSVHIVGKNYSQYNVAMQWAHYDNCSKNERGFSCRQTFIQENNFSNLGTRLCIDVQGVQNDIREMNQLLVTVDDREGDLKKIYSITRLKPEDEPYYVCTSPNQNSISVSITVRPSVSICPDILNYLFNNKINLGTVSSRPLSSIATVDLEQCSGNYIPPDESYLIKVSAEGARQECRMRKKLPLPYSYMRGCLKVVHFSNDFNCDVTVWLNSEKNDGSQIAFPVDRSPGSDMQRCETFTSRDGLPVLSFKVYPYRYKPCMGQFALSLDFRQTSPPDRDDDDDKDRSPNLYMAVFITLIAICLVCLGLTCLCCVRFRAKRLQRLQRRSRRRQVSVPNQGFQYDVTTAPPYDTDVPWSPPEPGQLFRLPSYDDVVAESSGGGINPSDDSYKNDLPPAYDTVCSTTET